MEGSRARVPVRCCRCCNAGGEAEAEAGGGRWSVVDRAGFVGGEETWQLASGDTQAGAQGTYSKAWTLVPASVNSESTMFGASEMNI